MYQVVEVLDNGIELVYSTEPTYELAEQYAIRLINASLAQQLLIRDVDL